MSHDFTRLFSQNLLANIPCYVIVRIATSCTTFGSLAEFH